MKIFFLIISLVVTFQLRAQKVPEPPNRYDWQESFTEITTRKVFYDSDILTDLESNSEIWLDIQDREETVQQVFYIKDLEYTFIKTKFKGIKIGNEISNHGLSEMITTNDDVFTSLKSSPKEFVEDINFPGNNFEGLEVEPLFSSLDLGNKLVHDLQKGGWLLLPDKEGQKGLRNLEAEVDLYFDNRNKSIETVNLKTGGAQKVYYFELEPNIWRVKSKKEFSAFQTDEGYCMEQVIQTEYKDYKIVVKNRRLQDDFKRNLKLTREETNTNLNVVLRTTGNQVRIVVPQEEQTDVYVYDLMGRLVDKRNNVLLTEIDFYLPKSGIYVIEVLQGNKFFTKKISIK